MRQHSIQGVVFNHTNAVGEDPNSNLDEVVPLYYHRLNADGVLDMGSRCADTASEHRMMEKLMLDTLVLNAKQYKIDGFRFDLMSYHFIYNLKNIRQVLGALTLAKDGIDGSSIYLYGGRLDHRRDRQQRSRPGCPACEPVRLWDRHL